MSLQGHFRKLAHQVTMFKLPCCQGQLALFPRETTSLSDKACEKLSDVINSCNFPWKLLSCLTILKIIVTKVTLVA